MRVIEDDYIFRNECYQIIGCCMEVHKQLGCGFKEAVYQEALAMEFIERSLHYEREKRLKIIYKGKLLKKVFSPDFVCFDTIILEMKASKELTDLDQAQLYNYLKISNLRLGLLINFGKPTLQYKRFIF